jgi:hypothetical protein
MCDTHRKGAKLKKLVVYGLVSLAVLWLQQQ